MNDQSQKSEQQSVAAALEEGIAAHVRDQLPEAERIYRQILLSVPDESTALHYLGVLLHQRERSDAAIELILRSIELEPLRGAWLNDLGNVFTERGRLTEAAAAFRRALAFEPCDANIWNNLGSVLHRLEQFDEAEVCYLQAIDLAPESISALNNYADMLSRQRRSEVAADCTARAYILGPRDGKSQELLALAYARLGQIADAAEICRQWLEQEPHDPTAIHLHAAYSGTGIPPRASDAYIEKSFDAFAANFDDKLVGILGYRGPELIGAAIARVVQRQAKLDVLDAGCGTGLCSQHLVPFARTLTGVDLSTKMLDLARQRGIYTELVKQELTSYLNAQSARFDLVAMADTLIYFGALEEIVAATNHALRAGGLFALTVETLDSNVTQKTYGLGFHGRYSHTHDYVEGTLTRCGFNVRNTEVAVLREEFARPVAGLVVTAEKC